MMAGERELGPASAFQMRVEQLKHTAFGQLLKAAELENSPEALEAAVGNIAHLRWGEDTTRNFCATA